MAYSPDGRILAVGGHDTLVILHDASSSLPASSSSPPPAAGGGDGSDPGTSATYTVFARCRGHSSTVVSVDWSLDGRLLQSSSQSYELLYHDGLTGRQVGSSAGEYILSCSCQQKKVAVLSDCHNFFRGAAVSQSEVQHRPPRDTFILVLSTLHSHTRKCVESMKTLLTMRRINYSRSDNLTI
jgi:WD40 repeat protein